MPACSPADHFADCFCWVAFFSPIFGCAETASSQSSAIRSFHIAAAVMNNSSSDLNGRELAIRAAHFAEPQQLRNIDSASVVLARLIRSSPLLIRRSFHTAADDSHRR